MRSLTVEHVKLHVDINYQPPPLLILYYYNNLFEDPAPKRKSYNLYNLLDQYRRQMKNRVVGRGWQEQTREKLLLKSNWIFGYIAQPKV